MNSDSNQNQRRLHGRRAEKLVRGSFKQRQAIEKSREKIRAYKESIVALNEEGRKSAAEEMKLAKEIKNLTEILPGEREGLTYPRHPLSSTKQRPTPSPPNRFIKPTNADRFK